MSDLSGIAQNQIGRNMQQLVNPLFWVAEFAVFGFAYIALFFFWRYVPRQVRATAMAVSGLWLLAMLGTGVLREVRIFSELSALLLLVIALGVQGWSEKDPCGAVRNGSCSLFGGDRST